MKCLAFDAITTWQVFSLARHARDAPQTPAEDLLAQDERAMIGAFVDRRQLRPAAERGQPFGTDIRSYGRRDADVGVDGDPRPTPAP